MIKLVLLSIALGTVASFGAHKEWKRDCQDNLAEGLKVLEEVYGHLSGVVGEERAGKLREKRSTWPGGFGEILVRALIDKNLKSKKTKTSNADEDDDDDTPCPIQNATWDCNVHFPDDPDGAKKRGKRSAHNIQHSFPRLSHDYEGSLDPFAYYAEQLHSYLSDSSACEGTFTDLNSITEAQLYGFLSLMATRTPGPFCPLCNHMAEELHDRLLKPLEMVSGAGHGVVTHFLSHLPSPKTMCSAIAPGCHSNFAVKATTHTDGTVCATCSFCTILTNVVQHKFLLDQPSVDKLFANLEKYFFRFACSEMCCLAADFPPELRMDYNKCQDVAKKTYYRLIEAAKVLLRPERLCTLEMGWCELNETPNLLHCLREICEESVGDNPFAQWVCTQIPDRPADADKFLNVHKTKVYKDKQEHHTQFEEKMRKKREAGEL
ncbi:hypothetical protein PRIPAC_84563 [Pristionchus pacificus]|uniref:Uncharacterized protein n=1 Tax=Pristionchus pacificus TaxID=54126 RepID=A0A454XSU2_PRIPA|nr:hypothetical protein PRIPAC_84563 [Pristionchus pacificus]|eukprot:PDM69667.1 hypothetical protein PRIPAC_44763 [Pristionchus pacificus]